MRIVNHRIIPGCAAALAMALAGCADDNPWGGGSESTGSIDISITTHSDIKASNPLPYDKDTYTRAAGDANDLNTYCTVPTADDFMISLDKIDGSFSKTWNTLADFKSDENRYVTGAYTLTASYGEKNKVGFDNPYFETSANFTVLANNVHVVDLSASLANSMVRFNYTDEFKNYMSDYYVGIRLDGETEEFKYAAGETRPVFVNAGSTNLTLHYTVKDTGATGTKNLGQIVPLAKTLHNVTLDVRTVNGKTGLGVTFDDTLKDEDVFIDLSEGFGDMMAPPSITCNGFANDAVLNLLEGEASTDAISMSVLAEAGMESATLTISGTAATPAWGREIDLCKATDAQRQQLEAAGVKARGFNTGAGQAAVLDLTQYSKSLTEGTCNISLTVTDKNRNVSDPVGKVTFDLEPMQLKNFAGTVEYAKDQATITLDYNGFNPEDIMFTASDNNNIDREVIIRSCATTRSFDTEKYTYVVTLPAIAIKKKTPVKVSNRNTGKIFGTYDIELSALPTYSISSEVDAFSSFAYMKVVADPAILATVTENIQLQNSNLFVYSRDAGKGILTVTGVKGSDGTTLPLTSGRTYSTAYSVFSGDFTNAAEIAFTMESELDIPNGNFSNVIEDGLKSDPSQTLYVGGKWWRTTLNDFQHESSFLRDLPQNWATINEKTAWSGSSNYNTWYVVPSSWVENGKAILRNVGYSHNGPAIDKTGDLFSTTYYCTGTPNESDLEHAAGEIFLGTYSFDGSEHRSEGISFASRPTSVSFDYEYTPIDPADKGVAIVEVKDADGNIIGSASFLISKSNEEGASFEINYPSKFSNSVSIFSIKFKSSNQTNPPIKIPTGSELNENTGTLDYSATLPANSYHALATGSILKIDNVQVRYGLPASFNPAKASPKRKANRKR